MDDLLRKFGYLLRVLQDTFSILLGVIFIPLFHSELDDD